MRPEQIEAWVLSLIDRVKNHVKVEDDARVELKADWPEPRKGARRIAGHANASGADVILWVIGLDEERGVVVTTPTEIAEWHAQVAAEFDGVSPTVIRSMNVPVGSGSVTALLFDVSRRPFVVKNAAFGTPGGGAVALEVPWREGTSTRTARREDLIRILVPLQTLPNVEVLFGCASTEHRAGGPNYPEPRKLPHIEWRISLTLYITPRAPEQLVLPIHKGELVFRLGGPPVMERPSFRTLVRQVTGGGVQDSQTVTATSSEAILTGPGMLYMECVHIEPVRKLPDGMPLDIVCSLIPAAHDRAVETSVRLLPTAAPHGVGLADYMRSWTSEFNLAPDRP